MWKGVRLYRTPIDFQAAMLQRFAFISPLVFAISQFVFVHDPCVVASTFESFLRYIFIYSRRFTDPGAKNLLRLLGAMTPRKFNFEF